MTDLGSLGGNMFYSTGYGINDKGEVTGSSFYTDSENVAPKAFVYSGGIMSSIPGNVGCPVQRRRTSGGLFRRPSLRPPARSCTPTACRLLDWRPSRCGQRDQRKRRSNGLDRCDRRRQRQQATRLPVFRRHANRSRHTRRQLQLWIGINAIGQVVGSSFLAGDQVSQAFIYSSGTIYDLNALVLGLGDATLLDATAINDSGQIVANSCCQAYRLDPVAGPPIIPPIEFYNAALDHYFFTYIASEVAILDAGIAIGAGCAPANRSTCIQLCRPIRRQFCRFYIPPDKGDSHFFGRGHRRVQCHRPAKSELHPRGSGIPVHVPAGGGGVSGQHDRGLSRVQQPTGCQPRLHVADKAVRDAMVAKGWLLEGDGPDHVVMCAPQ